MPKRLHHPFTITISSPTRLPGRFCWRIRRRGVVVQRGDTMHGTFEDARAAGKIALDLLIDDWASQDAIEEAA